MNNAAISLSKEICLSGETRVTGAKTRPFPGRLFDKQQFLL
jgi:hypothetical protein